MALSQSDLMRLLESLRTADGVESIRVLCERILQELIEAEATEAIGAAPREHTSERTTWRNGHRDRLLTSQAGDLNHSMCPSSPTPRGGIPGPHGRHRQHHTAIWATQQTGGQPPLPR
ncbi:transposase [Streptomyces sp. NPDC051214]|uniref:transposase n=1 Tax=Streptomyces sp. NPDC051214 TaxID=3155282 RepID=UPI00342A8FCB